ncbi:MAG TPA: thiamine pyrophosphate-dependent enzyme [Candidatus Binatia bacterium]|jgi:indolepyruvate ferredoxin oxidoreductase alpha subunit|nr:thiamine pyrophosphate-dependent enzyme [Candidatus Binatia bacterium]
MTTTERILISGNEAVAMAAFESGVAFASGYPGTPSTEILEHLSALGGPARWAPNEKVALEVALGAAFGGGRALAAMKHVGLNVAADPLFSAAYTSVNGALVVVSADDPGMASSQNEQDNRRYAVAAGLPMLEPSDSQEAYDFTVAAIELSERWRLPVLLRMTTRVCHSKTVVRARRPAAPPAPARFERDVRGRVMLPAYGRPAHRRLREKLARIAEWNETGPLTRRISGDRELGIIASGVAFMHAREVAPSASMLKLGLTYPLPMGAIANFAATAERCVVIEEGDPFLAEAIRAAGITVEAKPEPFRFGELNVGRVRRILAGDDSPEPEPPRGKPPALCAACQYLPVFEIFRKLNCIVSGDIGCSTLGALPPYEAVDSCVCMGASIGIGLGLRHVLPAAEARRVVSVIGDSTFLHSGMTGLVEMIYNPPPTGHLLIILDNSTTAMTGFQEHAGSGRALDHQPTGKVVLEDLARAFGIEDVHVIDPVAESGELARTISECLGNGRINVIVARHTCVLGARQIEGWARAATPAETAP